ncbi:MAG: class I SAM-dependent methyltransferase [Chlamydiales bacterium]
MKKLIMLACTILANVFLVAAPEIENLGRGEDSKLFLDPHLKNELQEVSGQMVLDVGCRTGDWSLVAAQNGATVCAVESKADLIERAQSAIANAGVEKQVTLLQGDVINLPCQAATFDRALSVNVGCQLPAAVNLFSPPKEKEKGLEAHFKELARVVKEGGHLVVSAPLSSDVLFTDGSCSDEEVQAHIQRVLEKIGASDDPDLIVACLSELKEVMRATFMRRDERLVLVIDEGQLKRGESIWYKVPDGAVSSYYHTEEDYLIALKSSGFFCVEIKRPCFFGKVKYDQYLSSLKEGEKSLGKAYISKAPFTIYYAVKQA